MTNKVQDDKLENVSGGVNENHSAKVTLSYSNRVLTINSSEAMKHVYVKAGLPKMVKTASADLNGAFTATINISCMQYGVITATITFMDGTETTITKQV